MLCREVTQHVPSEPTREQRHRAVVELLTEAVYRLMLERQREAQATQPSASGSSS